MPKLIHFEWFGVKQPDDQRRIDFVERALEPIRDDHVRLLRNLRTVLPEMRWEDQLGSLIGFNAGAE